MRRVFEEDDCYLDKYRSFKISRYQVDKYGNLVVTSDPIIFKGKLPHLLQRVLWELDAKDSYFVVSYNSKVKHNEYTD